MTQTFTSPFKNTASKATEEKPKKDFLNFAEPSQTTVKNILNYSKNLEVRQSALLKHIEFVKG